MFCVSYKGLFNFFTWKQFMQTSRSLLAVLLVATMASSVLADNEKLSNNVPNNSKHFIFNDNESKKAKQGWFAKDREIGRILTKAGLGVMCFSVVLDFKKDIGFKKFCAMIIASNLVVGIGCSACRPDGSLFKKPYNGLKAASNKANKWFNAFTEIDLYLG